MSVDKTVTLDKIFGFDIKKTKPIYAFVIGKDGTEMVAEVWPNLDVALSQLSGERGELYQKCLKQPLKGMRWEERENTLEGANILRKGKIIDEDWQSACDFNDWRIKKVKKESRSTLELNQRPAALQAAALPLS